MNDFTFTPQEYETAQREHQSITQFLDAAHSGTADLLVGARAGGKGREHQVSVPKGECAAIIEARIERARTLEKKYPITPWVAPKGVAGPPVKKAEK